MSLNYFLQTRNQTTRPTQNPSVNLHPGGYPWAWNWFERHLPQINDPENQARTPDSQKLTSPMSNSDLRSNANGRHRNGFNIIDYSTTPTSIRSSISVTSSKHLLTPSSNMPIPPSTGPNRNSKHSRIKESIMESPIGMKDSDSLASCPSFSVPNYMVPTVSAKAKVRSKRNPKDRFPITSDVQSNRRKSIRSFKWNKRLFFPVDNDSSWKKECTAKHRKMDSGEDLSVNSVPILPARANRMHLNRFA
ncbi:hypothetical protein SAY86_020098 [Trapa natans]|uniref:DUF4005 domain-containing protein n=1 Tax=Trapa natans TaxID=22666 RepID=A0AAN7R1G9_TRANT|nr:hypothetical protein SAY86_020098 [Trapa natans]